jgi:hypothetical protein
MQNTGGRDFASLLKLPTMLMLRKLLLIGLILLPCTLLASAQDDEDNGPEAKVKQAYEATCLAASRMFVDGILSVRAMDFEAFDAKGHRVDGPFERTRYRNLFERALSVKKKAIVSNFKLLNPKSAQCEVHEIDVFEIEEPRVKEPSTWTLDSRSKDSWALVDGKWKLKQSHILDQTFKRQGGKK